jgi:hypothetical protein
MPAAVFLAPATPAYAAVTVDQVDDAGAQLRALGEDAYPTDFAGATVDEATLHADLYVTSTTAHATDALVQATGSVPVVVHQVARSYRDLDNLQNQVTNDADMWTAQGVRVTATYPQPATNNVYVGIDPYSALVASAMQARYGAGAVDVEAQRPVQMTNSRFNDTSRYNGGDWAQNSSGSHLCTAGFGVHDYYTGTRYWITAGHCFGNGAGIYINPPQWGGSGLKQVGTVTDRSWFKGGGIDVELVKVDTSNVIWRNDTARGTQDGTYPRYATGTSVCHSGVTMDYQCGSITSTNGHFYQNYDPTVGDGCACYLYHQDEVGSSGKLVAGGDSGGPWFKGYTNSSGGISVHAVGIHSGGDLNHTHWSPYSDRLGNTNNSAYSYGVYTEMYWVLNTYAQSPTYMSLVMN